MRTRTFRWGRALRRSAALFLAVIAIWFLCLTCDLGAACLRLGESSAFVAAALQAELGPATWNEDAWNQLNRWQRLALEQSALLSAGRKLRLFSSEEHTLPPDILTPPSPSTEDNSEPTLPQTTTAPENIQERTLLPADTEGVLSTQGIALFNYTKKAVDLQALATAKITVDLAEDGPQILIMHTHGSEAYTMDGTDIYKESDPSRTIDEHYNVVRVGEEMKYVFEEMGLTVIHDRTLYDYPQYNGAYNRSGDGVRAWLRQYPSIQVVLDVHRDALITETGTVYKAVTEADGEKTAQVMMVIGTDDSGQEHPDWPENLALAVQIQQNMDTAWPTLARPITLRSSRFNQQLTPGSLLVEVGSHGNTLQEALRGARLFASATGEALLELKEP